MIGYLRGRVLLLESEGCLLDVNGVGYRLILPAHLLSGLRMGQDAAFYTHLQVREDALDQAHVLGEARVPARHRQRRLAQRPAPLAAMADAICASSEPVS